MLTILSAAWIHKCQSKNVEIFCETLKYNPPLGHDHGEFHCLGAFYKQVFPKFVDFSESGQEPI